MKERFENDGRSLLIEALKKQELVGGNEATAVALIEAGELVEFKPGEDLIVRGGQDNDAYFLVAGSVAILVKGTQVASRKAGTTVGEMAAIEPAQLRAATVSAEDLTVALKVSSPQLLRVGESHPQIWRPIARELSRRLYQRNELMAEPNEQPRLFIISSVEALTIAREIASGLQHDVLSTVWTDGVFFAGGYPLEALEAAVENSDFAVAIAQFEDIIQTRGETRPTLRDNVIFELGLFMGRLNRRRTILLQPSSRELKLPSDLHGLTTVRYLAGAEEDLPARLGPACNEIRKIVKKFGVRAHANL
jgi:CRP/FNR family transcriptional regulator, cyclic AMP receptor protein